MPISKSTNNKAFEELVTFKDATAATNAARFFKTGKGQYGEGDQFLGIPVPKTREIARAHSDMKMRDILTLLKSPYHEARLLALIILSNAFVVSNETKREEIVKLYLKNTKHINSWDLVDTSAYKILGEWLSKKKDRKILYTLAQSGNLWEERIAVVATFRFIKDKDFRDIQKLCIYFLSHKHDLMHKACGWMLREMGKQDVTVLKKFLERNARKMPRTALRYAIEKLSLPERKRYMKI